MITKIGIVAGDIWHYLEKKGEVTLSELSANLDKPHKLILMSLGWLAREGHVIVEMLGEENYKIKLRKKV
jgi:hypothetical protein